MFLLFEVIHEEETTRKVAVFVNEEDAQDFIDYQQTLNDKEFDIIKLCE